MSETEIELTTYSRFEDLADLRAEWDASVEANEADIFLTYDWCRIWWQYYGDGRELMICVFRERDRIVGILPLFSERIWVGPVWADAIKVIGSEYTLGQHGFPIEEGCLAGAMQLLGARLGGMRWDVLFLGNLSGKYGGYERLYAVVSDRFGQGKQRVATIGVPQTYFDVAGEFDAYLSTLKKKDRQLVRSTYRKLNGSFQTRVADRDSFAEVFEAFVASHQEYWRRRGKRGHFGDWPRSLEFHRAVAWEQLNRGRLRLLRVDTEAEGEAFQYSYRFGKRYYELLMGRREGSSPASIDLGRLLFAEQMRLAIAEGVRDIDSMRGVYDYKIRLGGSMKTIRRICVFRRSLRLAVWRYLARLLDLAYYRVWFCRLSTRLKLERPLNETWVRTSFLRGWGPIS